MLANLKGFGKRIRLKLEQPLHEAYADLERLRYRTKN
jgi:hypothetical protein